ncbi:MAG: cytochrome b/b6 domain-containing protein [Gammaproteobacteria bacterium]|nr:cytochrome b/b6 domain-containing protein [Gammaproteobacteria bacterium]
MELRPWDRGTRLIHLALAVAVTAQLFSGLVVSNGVRPRYLLMHTVLGIITTLIIALHWMWTWARGDLRVLFPWNRADLDQVGRELRQTLRGKLPGHGNVVGLSSFVHGLGLLAVTGMAATGILMYIVIPGGYGLTAHSGAYVLFTALATLHLWLSYGVWFYLGGHVVFAALQQIQGNHVLRHFYSVRH